MTSDLVFGLATPTLDLYRRPSGLGTLSRITRRGSSGTHLLAGVLHACGCAAAVKCTCDMEREYRGRGGPPTLGQERRDPRSRSPRISGKPQLAERPVEHHKGRHGASLADDGEEREARGEGCCGADEAVRTREKFEVRE